MSKRSSQKTSSDSRVISVVIVSEVIVVVIISEESLIVIVPEEIIVVIVSKESLVVIVSKEFLIVIVSEVIIVFIVTNHRIVATSSAVIVVIEESFVIVPEEIIVVIAEKPFVISGSIRIIDLLLVSSHSCFGIGIHAGTGSHFRLGFGASSRFGSRSRVGVRSVRSRRATRFFQFAFQTDFRICHSLDGVFLKRVGVVASLSPPEFRFDRVGYAWVRFDFSRSVFDGRDDSDFFTVRIDHGFADVVVIELCAHSNMKKGHTYARQWCLHVLIDGNFSSSSIELQ